MEVKEARIYLDAESSDVGATPVTTMTKATQPHHSTKRPDIQGLRTIAITAVLLFHLWPEWFPNGYLGVDAFFVISGYLMAHVLTPKLAHATPFSLLSVVGTFYQRRVQRIMPAYLILCAVTLLVGGVLLMEVDLVTLKWDALWALALVYNMNGVLADEEQDYFAEVG